MGTRNVTIVVSGGKNVVAQYGQWDGYPEGQGKTVLRFARARLRKPAGRAAFVDRLARCSFVSDDEVKARYAAEGIGEFMNMTQAANFKQKYPTFDRDMAAEVLEHVWSASEPISLRDESDFVRDSLMCEWAYVLDLDKATFEVYRGFNTEPVPKGERFADTPRREREYSGENQYFPVKHWQTWSLDALPTEKAFIDAYTKWSDERGAAEEAEALQPSGKD